MSHVAKPITRSGGVMPARIKDGQSLGGASLRTNTASRLVRIMCYETFGSIRVIRHGRKQSKRRRSHIPVRNTGYFPALLAKVVGDVGFQTGVEHPLADGCRCTIPLGTRCGTVGVEMKGLLEVLFTEASKFLDPLIRGVHRLGRLLRPPTARRTAVEGSGMDGDAMLVWA